MQNIDLNSCNANFKKQTLVPSQYLDRFPVQIAETYVKIKLYIM